MDFSKQIAELKRSLQEADLSDEERSANEAALSAIEVGLAAAAKAAEVATETEETEEKVEERSASDETMTAILAAVESISEIGRTLTEGQAEITKEIDGLKAANEAREVSEEVEKEEEATLKASESRSADVDKLTAAVDGLRKVVETSVPVRRGSGPTEVEETSETKVDVLERELEGIENPEMRLRKMFEVAARG